MQISSASILSKIPDKTKDKNTTSLKFKKDLIEYLGDEYRDKICLEVGTSKGYTTRILSFLFKKVITCEIDKNLIEFAKDINKDRDNIEFLHKDVYEGVPWGFEDISVVFIDCDHEINSVLSDINNSINLCKPGEELLIIFDDYGLDNPWKGVKEAISKYEDNPHFEIIKEIGQPEGWSYRENMTLRASEGIICKYENSSTNGVEKNMIFWRIINDTIYTVDKVNELGFPKSDPSYIPDEYLEKQIFTVCRTCLGIGDWGVMSAMPRLLKEKYPNCTVQIPSEKLLKNLFEAEPELGTLVMVGEWLKSWKNPYKTMEYIFRNNPYVDSFTDTINDEIFHDHYRIYDEDNSEIPIVEQMLNFWQFSPDEYKDSSPELYFTDEEKDIGDTIIKNHAPDGFGTLLLSNRFKEDRDVEFIRKVLYKNKLPYFYYVKDPSFLSLFDVNTVFDLRNVAIRVQMYIKTQAKILVGNMCGADIMFPRYTNVYMAPKEGGFGNNFVRGNLVTKIEDI
jgi:SAM-dependent methyltransferase